MTSRKRNNYDDVDDDYDEESKLLRTIPPGISARTHSINGTHTQILEPPDKFRSRWRSIRVMYLTMFLSSVSFSICMSSLYPYLKILDSTATTDFLGWVVAAYSVGQLVASPLFGLWSNCRKRAREPIVVSLIINVLANVLYMYLESITVKPKIFLLMARVLIGFGAGNVAVVRSYVSGATTLKERTSAMANMSSFQAVGFIIGPLIQTAMVPIGFPGPVHSKALHLDMYTSTAMLSAIVGVVNIVLLLVVFKEHVVVDDDFAPYSIQSKPTVADDSLDTEGLKHDNIAAISSVALFFSVLFIFSVFETIATPLAMHMFAWKKAEATLYIGVMLGCAGIISIGVFILIKILSKRFNERYILLGGFIFCLAGFVIYLPWGHVYPKIQFAKLTPAGNISSLRTDPIEFPLPEKEFNFSTTSAFDLHDSDGSLDNGSIQFPSANVTNNSSSEAVGCPYYYDWCFNTPAVQLWQFFLGTFSIAIGYPTCNVMSYTIYSKILGPKPQGVWMGLLTASGSLARTLGPVFVSEVYDAYGPRVTFVSMISMTTVTIVGLIVVFRKLIPFKSGAKVVSVK